MISTDIAHHVVPLIAELLFKFLKVQWLHFTGEVDKFLIFWWKI